MGVSLNSGTPKSSILIGFSIINHPFWGTTILGNPHIHSSIHRNIYNTRIFMYTSIYDVILPSLELAAKAPEDRPLKPQKEWLLHDSSDHRDYHIFKGKWIPNLALNEPSVPTCPALHFHSHRVQGLEPLHPWAFALPGGSRKWHQQSSSLKQWTETPNHVHNVWWFITSQIDL